MITKQDLELEYKQDVGWDIGHSDAPITFEEWVTERYLQLRNLIPKLKEFKDD